MLLHYFIKGFFVSNCEKWMSEGLLIYKTIFVWESFQDSELFTQRTFFKILQSMFLIALQECISTFASAIRIPGYPLYRHFVIFSWKYDRYKCYLLNTFHFLFAEPFPQHSSCPVHFFLIIVFRVSVHECGGCMMQVRRRYRHSVL